MAEDHRVGRVLSFSPVVVYVSTLCGRHSENKFSCLGPLIGVVGEGEE